MPHIIIYACGADGLAYGPTYVVSKDPRLRYYLHSKPLGPVHRGVPLYLTGILGANAIKEIVQEAPDQVIEKLSVLGYKIKSNCTNVVQTIWTLTRNDDEDF